MKITYKKKLFSDNDIEEFINLSKSDELRSTGMKDSNFIRWKFTLNPLGPSNYFYFENNNKIVGRILSTHYPGKIFINNQILESYCLSDPILFINLIDSYQI